MSEVEQYDASDFSFDEAEDADGPVEISRSELASLRAAAEAKGPVPDLRTRINQAKDTNEVMALLDEAGIDTAWNRY